MDEGGWNTVQGAKNSRVLDPSKFLKITKVTMMHTFCFILFLFFKNGFSVALGPVLKVALVDQAGPELTEIRLLLPPKCWD